MSSTVDQPTSEDLESWHMVFGPRAFNRTWELLDQASLTREEEEEMLATAFAQRYHWYSLGDQRACAIADWQVSRVAAVLGYADLALRFGQRSLDHAQRSELGPFIEGFAHEAIARAAAVVDDIDTFNEHLDMARSLVSGIEDDGERATLEADLDQMSES